MTTLHIAHANGFPGAVYQPLASRLQANTLIIPRLGHNPVYPVQDEWDALVQELIEFLVASSSGEKVFLVGHSLGSIVSFKLAHARPDLVSGLVMLDPPLIYGVNAVLTRAARWLGKMDDITPARLSKHRKRQWASVEAAEAYFRSKPFFAQLHPDVFSRWMETAIQHNEQGYGLVFDVATEVDIFRTTPLYLNRLKGRLQVPAWLRYANDSDATFRRCVQPFARDFGIELSITAGGHMFPLIALDDTAQFINRCLAEVAA